MNKKAVEWPVVMIYVIFVAIMLLIGIFMIFKIVGVTHLKVVDTNLDELKLTLLAERVLSSPDCLAYEEAYYIGEDIKFQVRPGIVDWSKAGEDINECLSGKDYYLHVEDLEGEWGSISIGTDDEIKIQDTYFIKIRNGNQIHSGRLTIGLVDL